VTELALPARAGGAELLELVDAFEERAPAVAGSAAGPNTQRAYATAYRVFAMLLRVRYAEASLQTFTLQAVAG
jgi:hypothetical protein